MPNAQVNVRTLVPLVVLTVLVSLLPAQLAQADDELASKGTLELCSLFEGQVFADVGEDNPFSFWITCIAAYGVAGGFTDGTYRSGQDVSRDQMSTFVVNAVEVMTGEDLDDSDAGFDDVDADNPHRDAINKLANAQIVDGFDDDTFRPRNDVRRDQMAKFIVGGIEHVIEGEMDGDGEAFSDVDGESPFFDDIDKLATSGIVDGFDDDTYRPRENVNRGQMAKFVGESMGHAHEEGHFPRRTYDVALSWVNVVDDGDGAPVFAQGEEDTEAAAQMLIDAALDCVIHVIDYSEVTGPFGGADGFVLHEGTIEETGPALLTLATGEDLDDAEGELQLVVCDDVDVSLYEVLDDPEGYYVQFHSDEHPDGAVRGQLPDGGQGDLPEEFQDDDEDDEDDGDDDDDGLLPIIPIPLI
jgi:hypothetical protein